MLKESEKNKIVNYLYGLLKESIYENGYFENFFPEKKDSEKKSEEKHYTEKQEHNDRGLINKRELVMRWLGSAKEKHSVLSYELFPDLDHDTARSEFSKKFRGEDADKKSYEFTDDEINTLYNMRDAYIKKAGLAK